MKRYLFIITLTIVCSGSAKECYDFDQIDNHIGTHEALIHCTAKDGEKGTVNSCDCTSPKSSDCQRACRRYRDLNTASDDAWRNAMIAKRDKLDNSFLEAVRTNDLAKVKKALKDGANINVINASRASGKNQTALMYAIENRNQQMLDFLLANGAYLDADFRNKGLTAKEMLAEWRAEEALKGKPVAAPGGPK